MTAPATTSAPVLSPRQREEQGLALRVAGLTYEAIGQRLGVTLQGARAAVQRALKRNAAKAEEDATTLRAVELLRVDRVVTTAMALMLDSKRAPDVRLRAADRILKAGERRADLLGLNAARLHRLDLAGFTNDELARLASGDDPWSILAARPLPEPPPAPAPPKAAAADDEEDEGVEVDAEGGAWL